MTRSTSPAPGDRSRLLDRLIESLDNEKGLDEAWDREAARRDAEIEDGTSVPVDGKEAVARRSYPFRKYPYSLIAAQSPSIFDAFTTSPQRASSDLL